MTHDILSYAILMNHEKAYNHKTEEALKRVAAVQGQRHISFKRPRVEEDSANPSENERDPFTSVHGACPNVSLRYKKVSRIGEGTYGIVYKAIDQQTSEYVALKRCLPHHEATDGFPITTLREIQILREISMDFGDKNNDDEDNNGYKYIVTLKDIAVGTKPSSVFLVFEYADFELAKLVDDHFARYSKSPFSLGEVKRLSIQLLSAVAFIHDRCIIHRDIKLSNLLYHQGTLKLCDFGLARRTSEVVDDTTDKCTSIKKSPEDALTPKVVSLWYRPIELLLGSQNYDMTIDCWACGCVMAELILGHPLFRGQNEFDQIQKIIDLMGIPRIESWPGLEALIDRGCFSFDGSSDEIALDMDVVTGRRPISVPSATKLLDKFGSLSASGIELLLGLLRYDPNQRWSASKAKSSSFFQESPKPVHVEFMPRFQEKM